MIRISKRQDIVEAAIRLIAEGGAEGLTASALAEAAGVSKANIFHHFARLDDIVLAALERFLLGMPGMQPAPRATLRDWLLSLGADTAAQIEGNTRLAGAYFGFIARARADEQLRLRIGEIADAAVSQFDAALEQLAPGRFAPAGRRALATLILLTGDGLAIHRQLFPEKAEGHAQAWVAFVDQIAPAELQK